MLGRRQRRPDRRLAAVSLDTATQPPTAERPTSADAALQRSARAPLASRRRSASSSVPVSGPPPRSRTSGCAPCTSPTAPPACAASRTAPTRRRRPSPPPARSPRRGTWTWPTRSARVFAAEARRHGVDVVLAPQVNLQRTPVGGRHFECYSEDPLLTGAIAVHVVRSAQDRGVGMCIKHFVANDSETQRTSYLARVDERTLREVYLAPFEQLVHEAQAWSVMGAYSGVDDGTTAAPALEHRPLLTGVLKDEWGFDGVVVSDWVATKSVIGAAEGGLDLQMPGPDGPWGDGLLDARARRRRQRVAAGRQGPASAAHGAAGRRARQPRAVRRAARRGRRRRRPRGAASPGVPLDGRAPRRRARAARRARRRHPHRPPGPERRPPLPAGRRLGLRPARPLVHPGGRAARRRSAQRRDRPAPRRGVPAAAARARPRRSLHHARGPRRRPGRAARRGRRRARHGRRDRVERLAARGSRTRGRAAHPHHRPARRARPARGRRRHGRQARHHDRRAGAVDQRRRRRRRGHPRLEREPAASRPRS